jgi:hypothetical protein
MFVNARYFFCLAFCGILLPVTARGQLVTRDLAEVTVDVWPEYDRPAALVMYRFRVPAGTDLSHPVAIPVPAAVSEPHAVAWRDERGSLFVASFTRRVEGERSIVLAQMGSFEGQLEFYTDIAFEGRRRSLRYAWPGGVGVGSLSVQVQQPSGATSFRITPPPARQWEGVDGLRYAAVELGRQDASATLAIEVSYERDTEALTAGATAAARPATPVEAPGAYVEAESPPWWLIGLGGVVLGALASAVFVRVRGRGVEVEAPSQQVVPESRFCHQCGTKCRRADAFCMSCGTKLVPPAS